MKKNGFTLVELLAVIIIIGITITLVIVKVDNNLKNVAKFGDQQTINSIESAALSYYNIYSYETSKIKTIGVDTITLQDLVEKGFIKVQTIKNYSTTDVVLVANVNGAIKTKYTKTIKPVIFLNGTDEISVYQNETYSELGAKVAIPNTGILDLDNSNISSNVDTTTIGKYEITYSYTNAESVKRIVNVISK